jgi:hypothetical protein
VTWIVLCIMHALKYSWGPFRDVQNLGKLNIVRFIYFASDAI